VEDGEAIFDRRDLVLEVTEVVGNVACGELSLFDELFDDVGGLSWCEA
jgi:hypothetical protein